MQKVLFISNISKRINSFSIASIKASHMTNLKFYMAANWDKTYSEEQKKDENKYNVYIKQINFSRFPFSKQNIRAYSQLIQLINKEQINFIHCNTPIGGILGRLAGKKCKVKKIIYQVHGFHFYKGAPLKNWLIYYSGERFLARFTDALITINHEDYDLAKRKFKLRNNGNIYYVPGVGIDLENYNTQIVDNAAKRTELGIPEDATVLLSVGELNENKNHETVIRAITGMDVYYIIAGQGDKKHYLEKIVEKENMCDRVKLLGFRSDVNELYSMSNIFIFPSFREGLSRCLMEAMANGLPCAVSNIRGNIDLIDEGKGGVLFDPNNVAEITSSLKTLLSLDMEAITQYNLKKIKDFSLDNVVDKMSEIYKEEFV